MVATNSRQKPPKIAMSLPSVCAVYDVRMQQQSVLQVLEGDILTIDEGLQVLKLGKTVLQWSQIEMASIALKNGTSFTVVFASRDHSDFDFLEVSLAITPAAASLVQRIHEHVEVANIPRPLLVLPLRKLYSGASFRQVYWWYQVVVNTLEIMFALTFFLTLQRRFSSSAEGILSSLAKLRDDVFTILSGEVVLPDWPMLAVLHNTIHGYSGNFFFVPFAAPLQIMMLLLDFHADVLILTMLLPHVFLLWHSITSLIFAVRKTLSIILKIGSIGRSMSKGTQVPGNKKNS